MTDTIDSSIQNPFKPTCVLPVEHDHGTRPCGEKVHVPIFLQGIHVCSFHALSIWELLDEQLCSTGDAARLRASRRREERKSQPADEPETGYVYYLRVGEHIKIGFATSLEQRLATYPPDTDLLAVEVGTMRDEMDIHRTFKPFRVSGREWYEPRQTLMDHIAAVAKNGHHTWWNEEEWRRRAPNPPTVTKPRYWR
ncbi:hypothetical protein GS539_19390 [Rhodococcus hoagii]|nr:hypothetical protein [Prescottella equi]